MTSSNNSSSSSSKSFLSSEPLLTFTATNVKPSKCPFANTEVTFALHPSSCIRLAGPSGIGKTTLANYLAGLSTPSHNRRLGLNINLSWNPSIPSQERCGVLFQQTTLLDSLSLAANIAVALRSCPSHNTSSTNKKQPLNLEKEIKRLLETVGLNYAKDAHKRPTQLSGGMARRASLALQLAQRKRVIILDEPFAGLDWAAAVSVAKELNRIRTTCGTALVVIGHEPDLCKIVMGDDDEDPPNNGNGGGPRSSRTIELRPVTERHSDDDGIKTASYFGITFVQRFVEDLVDFVGWSLPLITLAFAACALAIAMLTCDVLRRLDVTEQVTSIVNREVKPLIKLLTGEDPSSVMMIMVNMKVKTMLASTMPGAKAKLYAIGMAKLFVLEIGPLLTALLSCGRIGGSYAGKVGTMQATRQNDLLRTLGVNAQRWTLMPALAASVVASPLLTFVGTYLSLYLGAVVGPRYTIGEWGQYVEDVREATLPAWRLVEGGASAGAGAGAARPAFVSKIMTSLVGRCPWSDKPMDILIEIVTYPTLFALTKSIVFIVLILLVAEMCARCRSDLTPRHLPSVITSSVVLSSLVIIVADWGFSQLLLLRHA